MQADNIPCGAGFRFDDAFAEGDGIFADSDEVIAAYRVFPPQGGAPDDRRNALGIIGAVDVQVSGKRHQYVARFEDVRHFVPVAQVLVQREVVDEDNRLLPGCGAYNGVQPEYFLARDVGRSHTQARTGATADEAYSLPVVAEVGCFENLVEHGTAVFAPVHVVVARQQQIRFPEVFQNLLQQQELFGVSELRDVSA